MSLLLLIAFAYCELGYCSYPDYIQDAKNSVSSKMSYSFGLSECKASQHSVNEWMLNCTLTSRGKLALEFYVLSSNKAPYEVPTSFYLVASNDAARKSATEGLLSYLMINTALSSKVQGE